MSMDGNIQSGTSSLGGAQPIFGEGWVQLGGAQSKKIFWDSLSASDHISIIAFVTSAQFPMLIPPETKVSEAIDAMVELEKGKNKAIMGMLDTWVKGIQEQAEYSKKVEARREALGLDTVLQTYTDRVHAEGDNNFPLLAVGIILTSIGIQQGLVTVPKSSGIEFTPVVDMCKQVLPPMGDMRAEFGLLGAIYAAGIQYFTNAEVAAKSATGERPKDADFVKKYAENTMALMNSAGFNAHLRAIAILNIPKGEPVTEERILEQCSVLKVILLSAALATLYKFTAGNMTSIEFFAMIRGEIPFQEGDMHAKLLTMIRFYLDAIKNPALKSTLLTSLEEYFDSDPDIDALAHPAKVFTSISHNLTRGDLAG